MVDLAHVKSTLAGQTAATTFVDRAQALSRRDLPAAFEAAKAEVANDPTQLAAFMDFVVQLDPGLVALAATSPPAAHDPSVMIEALLDTHATAMAAFDPPEATLAATRAALVEAHARESMRLARELVQSFDPFTTGKKTSAGQFLASLQPLHPAWPDLVAGANNHNHLVSFDPTTAKITAGAEGKTNVVVDVLHVDPRTDDRSRGFRGELGTLAMTMDHNGKAEGVSFQLNSAPRLAHLQQALRNTAVLDHATALLAKLTESGNAAALKLLPRLNIFPVFEPPLKAGLTSGQVRVAYQGLAPSVKLLDSGVAEVTLILKVTVGAFQTDHELGSVVVHVDQVGEVTPTTQSNWVPKSLALIQV